MLIILVDISVICYLNDVYIQTEDEVTQCYLQMICLTLNKKCEFSIKKQKKKTASIS